MKTNFLSILSCLGLLCVCCTTSDLFVSESVTKPSLQKEVEYLRAYETFYERCTSVRGGEVVFPAYYGGA